MTTVRSRARRVGGGAVTLAVLILGVAGGLLLAAPAGAAGAGDIEVRMAGDTAFSTVASAPLLTIADLAPGGTVTGTMQIRDAGDTDGRRGITDTLSLQMINVSTSDECGAAALCAGSGGALADALTFDVDVTAAPPRPVHRHAAATLAALRNGVPLATKRRGGDVVTLSLSASLPPETGNAVAYGRLSFDLQLVLTPVAPGSDGGSPSGSGNGPVPGNPNGANGSAAGPGDGGAAAVQVLGTSRVVAPSPGSAAAGKGSVLVLGRHGGPLSYTGFPFYVILAAGAAVLLAGIALLYATRPRRRRPADPAEH